MSHDGRSQNPEEEYTDVREIYTLNSPLPSVTTSSTSSLGRRREVVSISSSQSIGSETESFTTLSREFNALVVAGSNTQTTDHELAGGNENLERIREDELQEETNPLAIVPDNNPIPSPHTHHMNNSNAYSPPSSSVFNDNSINYSSQEFSVQKVKKEETDSKISAWQTAEIAKINNRYKRQDVIISGWESEQVEKANNRLKKIERKLEEQRAKAMEKSQNDIAKARRKAEEKRASAEAKRGTKVAKVLQLSNFLRAVGRAPSKRSFF